MDVEKVVVLAEKNQETLFEGQKLRTVIYIADVHALFYFGEVIFGFVLEFELNYAAVWGWGLVEWDLQF